MVGNKCVMFILRRAPDRLGSLRKVVPAAGQPRSCPAMSRVCATSASVPFAPLAHPVCVGATVASLKGGEANCRNFRFVAPATVVRQFENSTVAALVGPISGYDIGSLMSGFVLF